MEFKKGDIIKVKFGNEWYYGKIKLKHKKSVYYTINFDDGETLIMNCLYIKKVFPPPLKINVIYNDNVSECSPRGISLYDNVIEL